MRLKDARKKEVAFARKLGAQGQRQLNAIVKDARGTGRVLKKTLDAGKADLTNVINTELQATYIGHAGNVLAEPSMNISGADWELVNDNASKWSRKYSVQQVNGMDRRTRSKVEGVLGELRSVAKDIGDPIPEFFERQTTLGTVRSQLQPVFGAVRSELIASTELTRAAYQGELAVIERVRANGFSMLGKWATSTDERTCPICDGLNDSVLSNERQDNIGLDGSVTSSVRGDPKAGTWNLTGIFRGSRQTLKIPGPPAHPRCRCWVNYELQTTPLRPKPQRRRAPAKKPLPPIPSARETRERILAEGAKIDAEIDELGELQEELFKKQQALYGQKPPRGDPRSPMDWIREEERLIQEDANKLVIKRVELRESKREAFTEILSEGKRPSKITRNYETLNDLPDDVQAGVIVGGGDSLKVIAKESNKGIDWLEEVTDGFDGEVNVTFRADRAKFNPDENKIYVRTNRALEEQPSVAVHEMAHGLESQGNYGTVAGKGAEDWYDEGQEWFKTRTIDPATGLPETPKPLNQTVGGLFGDDEIAICDKFFNCYVGKVYNEKGSEIYAMGLQYLYDDAVGFAKSDPDHFEFIVNALSRGGGA